MKSKVKGRGLVGEEQNLKVADFLDSTGFGVEEGKTTCEAHQEASALGKRKRACHLRQIPALAVSRFRVEAPELLTVDVKPI